MSLTGSRQLHRSREAITTQYAPSGCNSIPVELRPRRVEAARVLITFDRWLFTSGDTVACVMQEIAQICADPIDRLESEMNRQSLMSCRVLLDQSQSAQARMPALAHDDVIVHGDAERLGDVDDRLGHLDVGLRRRGIAARVVVHQSLL